MDSNLPQGSNIDVSSHNGYQYISIPHGNAGVLRYFIGIFLIFWLGGWYVGFTSALTQIMEGKGGMFLYFWLGGWSIGGVFAVYFIYRIFRKSVPERVLLNKPNLSIDTGIPPFKMDFNMASQKDMWKSIFPKRKKLEFSDMELKTIKLRETDSGNRLTIDKGSERFDIAQTASEIEREWLFNYLNTNYN